MTHAYEPPFESKPAEKSNAGPGAAATRLQEEATVSRVNHIDDNFKNCLDNAKDNHQSTMCGVNAEQAWDKVMNEAYKELRAQSNSEQKSGLQSSEQEWIKFRDEEFKSIRELYAGNGQGTMVRPWITEAQSNITKERAIELQNRAGNDTNGSVADRSSTDNPPDIAKADCSMMKIDCLGANYEDWDKALNENYQGLKSLLNPDQQEQLLKTQRQWLKFRDAEFSSIDSYFDSKYAGNRLEALDAKIDLVRKRALHLQHQKEVAGDSNL
jgi:uncharacterized protein YecT (DUF1311 family)